MQHFFLFPYILPPLPRMLSFPCPICPSILIVRFDSSYEVSDLLNEVHWPNVHNRTFDPLLIIHLLCFHAKSENMRPESGLLESSIVARLHVRGLERVKFFGRSTEKDVGMLVKARQIDRTRMVGAG